MGRPALPHIRVCCLRPGQSWKMSAGAGHDMSFPIRHLPWQSVPRSDTSDISEADSCISNSCEQVTERREVHRRNGKKT